MALRSTASSWQSARHPAARLAPRGGAVSLPRRDREHRNLCPARVCRAPRVSKRPAATLPFLRAGDAGHTGLNLRRTGATLHAEPRHEPARPDHEHRRRGARHGGGDALSEHGGRAAKACLAGARRSRRADARFLPGRLALSSRCSPYTGITNWFANCRSSPTRPCSHRSRSSRQPPFGMSRACCSSRPGFAMPPNCSRYPFWPSRLSSLLWIGNPRSPICSAQCLGFALFAWRSRTKPVTKTEAWSFAAVIVFRGLAPFHFAPASAPFTWIPFGGMLAGRLAIRRSGDA